MMWLPGEFYEDAEDEKLYRQGQRDDDDPPQVRLHDGRPASPHTLALYWRRRALAAEARLALYDQREQRNTK